MRDECHAVPLRHDGCRTPTASRRAEARRGPLLPPSLADAHRLGRPAGRRSTCSRARGQQTSARRSTFRTPTRRRRSTCSTSKFPARAGETAMVVFKANSSLDDPATRASIDQVVNELRQVPDVIAVRSPFDADAHAAGLDRQADRVRRDPVRRHGRRPSSGLDADRGEGHRRVVRERPNLQVELAGDFSERPTAGHLRPRPARRDRDPAWSCSARCWRWACRS